MHVSDEPGFYAENIISVLNFVLERKITKSELMASSNPSFGVIVNFSVRNEKNEKIAQLLYGIFQEELKINYNYIFSMAGLDCIIIVGSKSPIDIK